MCAPSDEEIFTTWTSELDDQNLTVVCLCGELDASSAPSFLADTKAIANRGRNVVMDVNSCRMSTVPE